MSNKAMNHAVAVLDSTEMSPKAALVLLAIAACHNQETGRCDPGMQLLSKRTKLGESTIRRAVRELEKLKVLVSMQRSIRAGSRPYNKTNSYRFTWLGRWVQNDRCASVTVTGINRKIPDRRSLPSSITDLVILPDDED